MILDSQGNPIKDESQTPPVEPVVVPPVEPVEPAVPPVVVPPVEPIVPPVEPVVPPVEPVEPIDLGYPSEVAPEFTDLLTRFESKGVKFDDVNLVLNDAIESGDISKLNDEALSSLVGDDAALIKLSLEGVILNAKNQSNANMTALYDAAGSKEAFESAQAFLSEASDSEQAMIEAGMKSDNKALQQLAVEKMMANFKQSPNYSQEGTRHSAQNTPDGAGDNDNSNVEYVTQRELADGLRKEMKSGAWDGTDANATPEVNRLRRGFLALRKYRQAREQ